MSDEEWKIVAIHYFVSFVGTFITVRLIMPVRLRYRRWRNRPRVITGPLPPTSVYR